MDLEGHSHDAWIDNIKYRIAHQTATQPARYANSPLEQKLLDTPQAKDLTDIYTLLRNYANQHGGAYPESLQLFINGSSLSAERKKELRRYRYMRWLKINSRDDRILLYSFGTFNGPNSKYMLIVRPDGYLEAMPFKNASEALFNQGRNAYEDAIAHHNTFDHREWKQPYEGPWIPWPDAKLSNLQLDIFLYARDHEGSFPPDLDTLVQEGYTPSNEDLLPDGRGKKKFVYIPGFGFDSPEDCIMLYDPNVVTADFAYGNHSRNSISYCVIKGSCHSDTPENVLYMVAHQTATEAAKPLPTDKVFKDK